VVGGTRGEAYRREALLGRFSALTRDIARGARAASTFPAALRVGIRLKLSPPPWGATCVLGV
jgi:hypothetical protein